MLEILVKKNGNILLVKTIPFNSINIEAVDSLYPIGQIVINAKKDLLTIDYFDDNKSLLRSIKSTNYLGAKNITYDDFRSDNVDMLNHIIELSMISEDRIMNALFVSPLYYEYHLMKYFYGNVIDSNGLNELLSETYVYDYIHTDNFLITIEHVYGEISQEIFIKNKLSTNPVNNDIKIYSDGLVEINNFNLYYFKDNNSVKKDEDKKDNDEYYKLSIFKVDENGKMFELCGNLLPHNKNKYIKDLNKLIEIFKSFIDKNDSRYFYTIIKEIFSETEEQYNSEVVLSGVVSENEIERIEALKK